jgi:transcription elongation factor GreA
MRGLKRVNQTNYTDTIALTPAGRADLEAELRLLRDERLPALAARLSDAREDPATRDEDAGLLELQEEQRRLERRSTELERLLAAAREIAPSADGVIALGSHVEIEEEGEREAFQLVDLREANAAEGRISTASPVGKALLGHKGGDEVFVPLPGGDRHLQVVSVS